MKGHNQLKIIAWNSRGLSASVPYIRSLLDRCDLLCISEHWLFENSLNRLGDISVDHIYVANASTSANAENYGLKRGQGGVAILWHKSITGITPIDNIVHERICGVRVQNDKGQVINVFSVYLPARGCEGDLNVCIDELSSIIDDREEGSYNLVCGDMNGDIGKLGGHKGKDHTDHRGIVIHEFMDAYNLYATNLQADAQGTRDTFHGPNGSSCIDYIMVPNDLKEITTNYGTLERESLNTSDHVPVIASLDLGKLNRCYTETVRKTTLKWDKLSKERLNELYTTPVGRKLEEVENIIDNERPSNILIDGAFETICNILRQAEVNIPKSRFKNNLKPFWGPELSRLKYEKVQWYRRWKQEGKPRDNNNATWVAHKRAEKIFRKALKDISRKYDDERILQASRAADTDKNVFWRMLKRNKTSTSAKVLAIRDENEKVVYEVDSVLEVWRKHFTKLCTPTDHPSFDGIHFRHVTEQVLVWANDTDVDEFTSYRFFQDEIRLGIRKLNRGKSPGHDRITTEHIVAAGDKLVSLLTKLFQMIVDLEYIPQNFRCGIQIPLHKGKGLSSLDPNSYRGITLLSSFNKLFEVVLWGRMKDWWVDNQVITPLQGAATPGVSCLHTGLLLQETIAENLEHHSKIFVSYYDVSKAFDGVWVDGLFYQLRNLGVTGKLWRLLYLNYQNFTSRVRIHEKMSKWYAVKCGIHQGGILSLLKYVAYINSLIVELSDSGLCCHIGQITTTPPGYADDLTTASVSKDRMDRIMNIVYMHGTKWRYHFNASKSAVLVYGEGDIERKRNSKYRHHRLGSAEVKEREYYDHVGIKACVKRDYHHRTEEKISKGRKALNAATSLGIKKGGVSMAACNLIVWSMVIPIITYGSEIWILKDRDIELLDNFQRYAGRRVQRLHSRSPRETTCAGLGWMRIEVFIYGKKMMFLRNILAGEQNSIYKQVAIKRFHDFNNDIEAGCRNIYDSPIYDMLRVSMVMGLYEQVRNMIVAGHMYGKPIWRKIVWDRVWDIEKQDWELRVMHFRSTKLLNDVIGNPGYLPWWQIADSTPENMPMCEMMAQIVCRASKLKSDLGELSQGTLMDRACHTCDNATEESIFHLVMQCDNMNDLRRRMFEEISEGTPYLDTEMRKSPQDIFKVCMGKHIPHISTRVMSSLWLISGKWIVRMYQKVLREREGVG